MNVAIIDYNAGNTFSVLSSLRRLGVEATITDNAQAIQQADKVIFPGVGSADYAMHYLKQKQLDILIPTLTQPVLGICLGMQLLCTHSGEGDTPCLGVFDVAVKKFDNSIDKVPHMGWNTVYALQQPLYNNIADGAFMYFVHSYYAGICKQTVSITSYGIEYSSALQKNNFYGVQYHPEKSGGDGQRVLENFIQL